MSIHSVTIYHSIPYIGCRHPTFNAGGAVTSLWGAEVNRPIRAELWKKEVWSVEWPLSRTPGGLEPSSTPESLYNTPNTSAAQIPIRGQ